MNKTIKCLALLWIVMCLISPCLAQTEESAKADKPADWTFLLVKPVSSPQAFTGSDGLTNLVYEVVLSNFGRQPATLKRFEVLNQEGKAVLSLEGKQLTKAIANLNNPKLGNLLAAGSNAVVWVNIDFKDPKDVPSELNHRVVYDMRVGKLNEVGKLDTLEYTGGKLAVNKESPIVITPPLSGGRWVVFNSYDIDSPHRRGLFPTGNRLADTQRFAIDWLKLDDEGRFCAGDLAVSTNYPTYGQPVFAVTDGTVVGVIDKFQDQKPGVASGDRNFPGGNTITIKIGNGQYAFYAHLKPNSIKVKEGDSVKRGQFIAMAGNSGNTSNPHLHFHISDSPELLGGNSLPYVFDSFQLEGKIRNLAIKEGCVALDKPANAGLHINQIPKEGDVVTFPVIQKQQ